MSELKMSSCINCGHSVMTKDGLVKHTNVDSAGEDEE